MTPQLLLRSPPVNRSRHLLSDNEKGARRERRRVGEMAGGTTAECTAVCCCCPCAVMNLVVLAVYKVPAGLCRKAIHKRKRQRMLKKKKNDDALLLRHQRPGSVESQNVKPTAVEHVPTLEEHLSKEEAVADEGGEVAENTEAVELEEEMWARFNGTGFWRSSSRRQ